MNNSYYQIIENSIQKNKLSQVYLLISSPHINMDKYIIHFINKINNEQFDIKKKINFIDPYFLVDGKKDSIKKEDIINAIKNSTESTMIKNNKSKILIIKNIENGSPSSLNALLKFLENVPNNLIVLLTTNNKNKVLKTIRSRSFEININREKQTLSKDKFINFISLITDDNELIDKYSSKENLATLNELSDYLYLARTNPLELILFLYKSITIDNVYLICSYMQLFYAELYCLFSNGISSTNFIKTNEYLSFKNDFKYTKAIKIIKDFIKLSTSSNANFKLQKSKFIIKLKELYGK